MLSLLAEHVATTLIPLLGEDWPFVGHNLRILGRRCGRRCSASTRRPNARPWTGPAEPSDEAGPGRHDERNGTIDLFAAMNLATGQVLTEFRKTHKGAAAGG
jgi:hypothetical protein